ncbi:MAG: hypothetical protein RBT59_08325 [Arcobacteraceae bacterium]|jgi:hypothetical protein|nr:hypothetical protein [Arcobacteraceae bacterium]
MFSKIIGKIKNKSENSDKKHAELVDKISTLNLTDMRVYVKNKLQGFEVTEEGLVEVLKRLISVNKDTSKRYLEIDDMDSKIKKGFELVISISTDKRITINAIELIQKFIIVYDDVIIKYDTQNKEIYGSRLKSSVENGIMSVDKRTKFGAKQHILNP